MDNARLEQLEKDISEIKTGQAKLIEILLGSINDKDSVGIIEETRSLRKDILEIQAQTALSAKQIQELTEFKSDAKRAVIGLGVLIPAVFEILKFLFSGIWIFKTK